MGTARLMLPNGKTAELPVYGGVSGPDVVDVRGVYSATGCFCYDPGFKATCSCASAITYIDGPRGVLLHRGYAIEELAADGDFDDVSYLLLFGDLPDRKAKALHSARLVAERRVHERLIHFYSGFLSNAHPMAIMVGVVGALSAFYHDKLDVFDAGDQVAAAYRVIAKLPTLAAMAYKTAVGEPFVYPRDALSHCGNLLHMLFAKPGAEYVVDPLAERALEVWMILHMDHEQNASTSTVRIAGSSEANPYAAIASGITALWGPAHGGANEAVIRMLEEIGSVDQIPAAVARAKDKSDSFRLMGFGHRVYKSYDPRARILKSYCHELLGKLQREDPLMELALELEKVALEDEYFVSRGLYPNTDFYSGIILRALGIPRDMYTVLFAVARTVGWISQWREMISDSTRVIGRPRQLYVGPAPRSFAAVDDRAAVGGRRSKL